MSFPEVEGYQVLGLIGSGESGRVFAAQNEQGKMFAIKVFEGMAINRGLLIKAISRLESGEWPSGLLRVESADLVSRPACLVMPFLGDKNEVGNQLEFRPWSLQHQLDEHPGEKTWDVVKEISSALASMHRKRVSHGNLKPGNVFFDESGEVKLVDWTLGNMPGISHFDFTDALLYQAPEQLLDATGYFEETGYRWDVFSFGVLSYRLVTGKFPRCEEIFSTVAPVSGETQKTGIHADHEKVAESLVSEPEISWPYEARNGIEERYRIWIEKCLKLNPEDRPSSMIEVTKGLADVDADYQAEETRVELIDQRRHAQRKARRLKRLVMITSALCLVLLGLWQLTSSRLKKEYINQKESKVARLKEIEKAASAQQSSMISEEEMRREYALGLERLEASRMIGDQLFDWAMKQGHRTLPALDGREVRLKKLEKFYEGFLEKNGQVESLEPELARARLQLAEVALAAGDTEKAEQYFSEAIASWSKSEIDAEMRLRLGEDALLLALLKLQNGREDVGDAFKEARTALVNIPEAKADGERLQQLRAVLDFNEARWLASKGDETGAMGRLLEATRSLNDLVDKRPDAAVLRSELASCYLSSATILEGMGKLGDARQVRTLASVELTSMLKKDPKNADMQLELAGCLGAMAEASLLSGDVQAASDLSADTMKLLEEILQKQPESVVATTRKAAQLGLQAGLLRDQGKSEESLEAYDQGIGLLERQQRSAMVDYRLALLLWQKGRMLGFSSQKEKEMELLSKAGEMLKELEIKADPEGPRLESLQRSRAYLLGDYALALELSKNLKKAKTLFLEVKNLWTLLVKSRPQSEEYNAALDWTTQRISDFQK